MSLFTGGDPGPGHSEDPHYQMWLAKKAEWWAWHKANPEVWEYFKSFTFDAVSRKKERISHWLILNRVRWEVWLTTTTQGDGEDDFKIPNEHFAFYARLWKATYPQHSSMFLTKRMIGEPADSPLIGR